MVQSCQQSASRSLGRPGEQEPASPQHAQASFTPATSTPGSWSSSGIDRPDGQPEPWPPRADIHVIGAGFGRTGTLSLKVALEILGYHTHHMSEVFADPDQPRLWTEAHRMRLAGKPIDWDRIFGPRGFTAAVDWPACAFYKELMQAFPHAKVVMTLRDFDSWYRSACNTIYAIRASGETFVPPFYLKPFYRHRLEMQDMPEEVIWQGTFGGRMSDREHARKVYQAHVEEVRRVVPSERLLLFELADGWDALACFLGEPVPQEPFPHVNDSQTFKENLRQYRLFVKRSKRLFAVCNTALVLGLASVLLRGVAALRSRQGRR